MTLTVDITELVSRLDELLAEAESGGQVVVLRGTEPMVKIEKAVRVPQSALEEWLMWREEDRRRLHEPRDWM